MFSHPYYFIWTILIIIFQTSLVKGVIMKLAERLRELRKERTLRQEQVAVALDISMSAYCNYEQGKREPTASVIIRMADYYDVTTDYLLGRSNNRK